MSRQLVSSATVLASAATVDSASLDATSVTRAIDAASAWIERYVCRYILANTADGGSAADQIHSGERARRIRDGEDRVGTTLYLQDHLRGWYTLPVSSVGTVTEDGEELTVISLPWTTTPADTDYACLLAAEDGRLVRCSVSDGEITPTSWADGYANIRVATVAAGWAADAVPADIAEVCVQLALIFLREGPRGGLDSANESGYSASYSRLLMPEAKRILSTYARRMGPRTREG